MNYVKGQLKITIMEVQYDPKTDSIENWLYNYSEVSPVNIIYSDSTDIRIGGSKVLKVDTADDVEWSINGYVMAELLTGRNSVKVICPFEHELIGKENAVKAEISGKCGICRLKIIGGI